MCPTDERKVMNWNILEAVVEIGFVCATMAFDSIALRFGFVSGHA